ncbi:MAG: PAS domain S-box protein [Desulfomicrobium escambiense]|nr:PAS domain S-box protein [Desulfomicrobium escambiense]
MWQCDAEGRYIYLNPAWEGVFGYRLEEMLGRSFADFQSPECAARDAREFTRLLQSGSVKAYETVHRAKDGRALHLVFNAKSVTDEGGRVLGTRGTAYDITERKRAEEELAHSDALMRYIIEHNRSAVAVHDREMRYLYVSQRYLDDYQVKERDIIGKHHYEVFPDLPQKWRDVHRQVLAGAVMSAEDDPYEKADGSVEWTRWEVPAVV